MTPAITALKKARIPFTVHEYEHDVNTRAFGLEAAQKLNLDPQRVFKTLIVELDSGALAVAIVPVAAMLNMKLMARAVGAKKAVLAERSAAERSSGYIMGGISPLGQKKRLKTVVDESALQFDSVFVSGGRRGLDLELAPQALVSLCAATTAAMC
jgi:Cys-tRNA(Pro)/Cys-tRNA(Cys) deacylase